MIPNDEYIQGALEVIEDLQARLAMLRGLGIDLGNARIVITCDAVSMYVGEFTVYVSAHKLPQHFPPKDPPTLDGCFNALADAISAAFSRVVQEQRDGAMFATRKVPWSASSLESN